MPQRRIDQIERMIAELQADLERERENHPESGKRSPWWKRWWRGFVAASRKSVILTVRSAAGATLIVVLGFFALRNQTETLAERRIDDIDSQAAQAVYDNAIQVYTTSALNRTICLNGVAASDRNRAMWEITVSLLRQNNLDAAADVLAAGPLLVAAPRQESECPPLAELPFDPQTGLQPPVDPDTNLILPSSSVPG